MPRKHKTAAPAAPAAQLVLTRPDHPCCRCGQPTVPLGYQPACWAAATEED